MVFVCSFGLNQKNQKFKAGEFVAEKSLRMPKLRELVARRCFCDGGEGLWRATSNSAQFLTAFCEIFLTAQIHEAVCLVKSFAR